jgi:phage shock protein C
MNSPKRLYRSRDNRMIGGVCGGLAEYFNIDPTLVRLVFLILFLAAGSGPLLYRVMWVIVPAA